MVIKQAITKLIKQPESETFEKKPSLADIGRMVEIISSFANHKGGKILVGASDKGKIMGIDIGKNTIERLTDTIIDHTEPKIYPEISTIKSHDKNLILISVKPSSQKPHTANGRPFKRVGKNTKAMSQSEYESLLLEKNKHKMKFDIEICEEASFEDISVRKISWYLKEREKARNISRKINMTTKELLINLKCLINSKPTNAGILFFGKYPQRFMPNARLRVVKFKGNDVINPTLDSVTCEGTLPDMIDLVEDFIRKNIRLLGTRTAKSFRREDKFEYPIKAVREAVINALIHRNYFETGDVRVFIFDNRIEITNPGTFPKGVTPEHPEHKPVNEILCQLIFDIGQIEKYGSGIKMMRSLSKEWGNKEPYYKLSPISSTIIFESQIKGSSYIEISPFKKLNERQKKAVEYLKHKGKITNREYRKLYSISSQRIAAEELGYLMKNNIIIKHGKGRSVYYNLVND